MSGIFTPQMVVNDIMNVVDKNRPGYIRLKKFYFDPWVSFYEVE